jgi:hypothetical protein
MWNSREHRYCAFCKAKRKVYLKKHVGPTNVLAAFAFALVTTFAVWGEADPRGLVLLGCYLVGAEVFVRLRWRIGVVCKMCGFDPVLYKKSPKLAAERVRRFFAEQAKNPEFFLTSSPLLEVHRRLTAAQKQAIERELAAKQKAARLREKTVTVPR